MAPLDRDRHPCLVWLQRAQFSAEDRASFVALVERYEDTKAHDPRAALDLLEAIPRAAGGMRPEFVNWYRRERAGLGFPVSWAPLP